RPRVEPPVLRAEQLAPPDAVEPGGLDGVDPLLQRDAAAARPDVPPALPGVPALPEAVPGVTEIDAGDQPLVEPGDVLRPGAAAPQVVEVEDQADVVPRGLGQ